MVRDQILLTMLKLMQPLWCLNVAYRSTLTILTSLKLWMFQLNFRALNKVLVAEAIARLFLQVFQRMLAILEMISTSLCRTIALRMSLVNRDRDLLTKVHNFYTLLKAQFMLIFRRAKSDRVTNNLPVRETLRITLLRMDSCMMPN